MAFSIFWACHACLIHVLTWNILLNLSVELNWHKGEIIALRHKTSLHYSVRNTLNSIKMFVNLFKYFSRFVVDKESSLTKIMMIDINLYSSRRYNLEFG